MHVLRNRFEEELFASTRYRVDWSVLSRYSEFPHERNEGCPCIAPDRGVRGQVARLRGQCIHRCHFDREYGQQTESAAQGPDCLAHVVIGFCRVIHHAMSPVHPNRGRTASTSSLRARLAMDSCGQSPLGAGGCCASQRMVLAATTAITVHLTAARKGDDRTVTCQRSVGPHGQRRLIAAHPLDPAIVVVTFLPVLLAHLGMW
jgi:hypothetical protein